MQTLLTVPTTLLRTTDYIQRITVVDTWRRYSPRRFHPRRLSSQGVRLCFRRLFSSQRRGYSSDIENQWNAHAATRCLRLQNSRMNTVRPYLPIDLGEPVALVLEDSRHYALASPDADAEWESVYPGGGLGFVRLGPNKRFFSLSMYHQMHCLDSLRRAILGQSGHHAGRGDDEKRERRGVFKPKRDIEHSAHCLNYLRQTTLCASDLTLEPEIEEGSQEVGEGLAVTHVCRDWSKVHEFVKGNWEEWQSTNGSAPRV
ncbi:hypothetical protein BC835DRAFT_1321895 [Cytidiella melzeri]|nr:hypothetical protein BC835DRAFT_1321895 [Cytidiella melzeri]